MDRSNSTAALFLAAETGDETTAKQLLQDRTLNLEATNSRGETLLMTACDHGVKIENAEKGAGQRRGLLLGGGGRVWWRCYLGKGRMLV